MTPKRLLCCMSSMDAGGAETFLMKQYRALDRAKYQMDFCVNKFERGYYDDEIESLGGRMYRIPPKSKDFSGSLKALETIVKENGYQAVLVSSVKPGTALELLAAKRGGAERRHGDLRAQRGSWEDHVEDQRHLAAQHQVDSCGREEREEREGCRPHCRV